MRRAVGFTLIELLVVMAIMASLLALAAPRYFHSVDRAKEAALKTNLRMLREAIDKHRGDTGQLPASLDQLVERRYLKSVPIDPITDSAGTWKLVSHPDGVMQGVYDVRSGAVGPSSDGRSYGAW
jgi:general secretion pathway protein G